MKKLLVIAVMSLFAVSAFAAVDVEISGFYEIEGRMIVNNSAGNGGYGEDNDRPNRNESYIQHSLRIWAKLLVDPNTTITIRTTPVDDRLFGRTAGDSERIGTTNVALDRAWITYKAMDMLSISLGRMSGNNYTNGFASGFYNATFAEGGARDQIRFDFDLFGYNVFAIYEKGIESSSGEPLSIDQNIVNGKDTAANGWDRDSYILGANLEITEDFYLIPVAAYTNDASDRNADGDVIQVYGFYLSAEYRPAFGLNAILSGSYVGGNRSNTDAGEDLTAFGFYGDISFVDDFWTIGVLGAYASYDDKDGAFGFGGDFDKTTILDDLFGDDLGLYGMTMFQIYGTVSPIERMEIGLSGSYYFSNMDSSDTFTQYPNRDNGLLFNGDTNAFEIDVDIAYALSESTVATVGYAYAQINDLGVKGAKWDADAIHKIYWNVYTEF